MEAQTEIDQALLTQIGIIQKNWELVEERLTKLGENMSEEEKEREERLINYINILRNNQKNLSTKVDSLTTQLQSLQELPEQLKALEQLLKNG